MFRNTVRKYVARRALMYVPASDEKKLAKIPSLKADCVTIDLEDAVALSAKDNARKNAVSFLENQSSAPRKFELGVRVNPASSGLLEHDLKALLSARKKPDALMLPKVDSLRDVRSFYECFRAYSSGLAQKADRQVHPLALVVWIESAQALLNMSSLVRAVQNMCRNLPGIRLDALVFGSDDFCADIGATRSKEAHELVYARQKFVTTCKAFRLQAIDIVFIDFKDLDGLREQSIAAAAMGFTGKQVIHPSQVPVVQEAFTPSPERQAWARQLVDEFNAHERAGTGAFTFRGQMIDMPLVLQAKNILQLAQGVER